MRSSVLFESLQNLIGRKPSQNEIAKIIKTNQSTIANRVIRNSNFSDEEVELIEHVYNISLRGNRIEEETVPVDYFPEVFGSCGDGKFVLSEQKELIQVPKKFFFRAKRAHSSTEKVLFALFTRQKILCNQRRR